MIKKLIFISLALNVVSINSSNLKNNEDVISFDKTIVSAGRNYSLFIDNNDEVYTWGSDSYSQQNEWPGVDTQIPFNISTRIGLNFGERLVNLANGERHTLALTSGKRLIAWGQNDKGQIGNSEQGNNFVESADITNNIDLEDEEEIIQVTGGSAHSLALTNVGAVWAWGSNRDEQLALSTDILEIDTPTNITNKLFTDKIIKIASGTAFNLALTNKNEVIAWGANGSGQLGNPDIELSSHHAPTKVKLPALTPTDSIIDIVAGGDFGLILTDAGRIIAFGSNSYGQLPDGQPVYSANKIITPKDVTDRFDALDKVTKISAGESHALVLTKFGNIYAFGNNEHGQLGAGSRHNMINAFPINITNKFSKNSDDKFTDISAGASHSIVSTNSGEIYAFGNNNEGQLGVKEIEGQKIEYKEAPLDVTPYLPATISLSLNGSEEGEYSNSYKISFEITYPNNIPFVRGQYLFCKEDELADLQTFSNIANTITPEMDTIEGVGLDGTYRLLLSFTNKYGNETYYISDNFNFKSTPPAVYIYDVDGMELGDYKYIDKAVTVKSIDNSLYNLRTTIVYKFNDSDWQNTNESTYTFLSDGQYEIVAVDAANNLVGPFKFTILTARPTLTKEITSRTKKEILKVQLSTPIIAYTLGDGEYTMLEKPEPDLVIKLQKGTNRLRFVDLAGNLSEVYVVNYTPPMTTVAIFIACTVVTVLTSLVIYGYLFYIKSRANNSSNSYFIIDLPKKKHKI